jgi:hypothetical protein
VSPLPAAGGGPLPRSAGGRSDSAVRGNADASLLSQLGAGRGEDFSGTLIARRFENKFLGTTMAMTREHGGGSGWALANLRTISNWEAASPPAGIVSNCCGMVWMVFPKQSLGALLRHE